MASNPPHQYAFTRLRDETHHAESRLWAELKKQIQFASFFLRLREGTDSRDGSAHSSLRWAHDRVWYSRASLDSPSSCSHADFVELQFFAAHLRRSVPAAPTYIAGLDEILANNPLLKEINRGDVIEFQGARTSGASHFLAFLAMTAILPSTYRLSTRIGPTNGELHAEINFGGKDQTIVWIDTSGAYDVDRLATMLRAHISTTITAANLGLETVDFRVIIEEIMMECLEKVTVYSPRTTIQMAYSVAAIERAYMDSPTPQQEIGYVFVDSLSDFTWSDIVDKDASAHSPAIAHLITALTALRTNLAPIIVLAQYVLKPSLSHFSADKLPFYSNHLPPPWPTIHNNPATLESRQFGITAHITLHPPKMKFIPSGVALEAAMKIPQVVDPEEYTAVVRVRGGKEIGSWLYNLSSSGVQ